jgi:hypothetical protein
MKAKQLILLISLMVASAIAAAAPTSPAASVPVVQSDAMQFAIQAGSIAAFAQVCGENTTTFSNRVLLVINKLGADGGDKITAWMSYKQLTAPQQIALLKARKINLSCQQVLTAYRNLPLMQQNYTNDVLNKM